jgi:hypothetical protein
VAFDKTPTTWIAGWSVVATDIVVPIASFTELTAAEADGTTGDIRKIVFAVIEKLWQAYNATATADRPVKWKFTKTASVDAVRNTISHRYNITLETEIGTQEVNDETSSSPTATSTSTASATSTGTSTSTPTSTSTASATSTSTSTSSATITTSGTKTGSASATASASKTATSTATASSTGTGTSTPTSTSTASGSSTATATGTV